MVGFSFVPLGSTVSLIRFLIRVMVGAREFRSGLSAYNKPISVLILGPRRRCFCGRGVLGPGGRWVANFFIKEGG